MILKLVDIWFNAYIYFTKYTKKLNRMKINMWYNTITIIGEVFPMGEKVLLREL